MLKDVRFNFHFHLKRLVLLFLYLLPFLVGGGAVGCRSIKENHEEVPRGKPMSGTAAEGDDRLAPSLAPDRKAILSALEEELARARRNLRRPGYPAPYFLAFRVRDDATYEIAAKYGALTSDDLRRERAGYAEVRVGDYSFDNRGARFEGEGYAPIWEGFDWAAPREAALAPLRRFFWLLSDAGYKGAIESYLRRRAEGVQKAEDPRTASFARAEVVAQNGPLPGLSLPREQWRRTLRRASAALASSPEVIDSGVRFWASRSSRFLVTSEGTRVSDGFVRFSLQIEAFTRAPDGEPLTSGRVWAAPTLEELPDAAAIEKEAHAVVAELLALRAAPVLPPYTGPAILAPDATGVFFHEAVGHRLEGERQEDEYSGQTFRQKIGEEIIPAFLSVYDDPTLSHHRTAEGEIALSGYYEVDDEGVRAQRVPLVEGGRLRGFLLSRAPVEGFPTSNGHGRADAWRAPMARMGNLIVRSDKEVPAAELVERLRAEARAQGLPFGLMIEDVEAGETNTYRWGIQTFRGTPRRVWKVDTATGERTLVRGVEIIGTPLASIKKILATGDDYRIFNGYCGAESGMVPVSTAAPSALLSEIETQRPTSELRAGPLTPPPPIPNTLAEPGPSEIGGAVPNGAEGSIPSEPEGKAAR